MIKYIIGLAILGLVGCSEGINQNEKDGTVVNYQGLQYTVEKAECSMTQISSTSSENIAKIEIADPNKAIFLLYCDNSNVTENCQNQFPSDGASISGAVTEIKIYDTPYVTFTCLPGTEFVDTNLWWFIRTRD